MTVAEYFSLKGPKPVFGASGVEMKSQVMLFIGVLLGALSKEAYNFFDVASQISIASIAIAAIASVVVFPQLYYVGGLDKRPLSFAHWTLAFQNGFFWSVAMSELVNRAA